MQKVKKRKEKKKSQPVQLQSPITQPPRRREKIHISKQLGPVSVPKLFINVGSYFRDGY